MALPGSNAVTTIPSAVKSATAGKAGIAGASSGF
jgi:hypothetical protein